MLNRDPRIVMLSQSDRGLWCEIACAICTTSAPILHTSASLHLERMELHMVEKVHTCGRLHRVEHGVRDTIKEIKSTLLPGEDKVAHHHRGRTRGTLFTAKIKLFQFIADVGATNLKQKHWRRGSFGWYESFSIATVYLVLGPLQASFGSLSGPFIPQRLLLTVRRCLPQ